MKPRLFFAATVAAVLSGCAMPVTDDEVDWRTPILSRGGCPDLSGTYTTGMPLDHFENCPLPQCAKSQPVGLLLLVAGPAAKPSLPNVVIERMRDFPREVGDQTTGNNYLAKVTHDSHAIEIRIQDETGTVFLKGHIPSNHPSIGCYRDALIIRRVAHLGGAEGAKGVVKYSEVELRRRTDGSIVASQWENSRVRSRLTGAPSGIARDVHERAWVFKLIHR